MIYIVTDKESTYYGKRVYVLGIQRDRYYVKFITESEEILFPKLFNIEDLTPEDKLKFDLI